MGFMQGCGRRMDGRGVGIIKDRRKLHISDDGRKRDK